MSTQASENIQSNKSKVYLETLFRNLNNLRKNPAFCDVNIKFDNQNTWAHKVILAAKSEYFSSMFLGNFKESSEQVVNICFDNKDLSSTAIDIIVTYMYTLDLEITEDNVQGLLVVSKCLLINEVYEACKNFIQQNIDASNVIEYQNFAKLNYEGMLYNHCSAFILNNFILFSTSQEFLSLPYEVIMNLVQSDELNADYNEICDCVKAWVNHDKLNRSEFLPNLLKCVKLDTTRNKKYKWACYRKPYIQLNKSLKLLWKFINLNRRQRNELTFYGKHRIPNYRVLLLLKKKSGVCAIEWVDIKNGIFYKLPLCWSEKCNSSVILNDGRIICTYNSEHSKHALLFDGETQDWSFITMFHFNINSETPYTDVLYDDDCIYLVTSQLQCFNLQKNESVPLNFDFDIFEYFNHGSFKAIIYEKILYAFGQNKAFSYDLRRQSLKRFDYEISSRIQAVCVLKTYFYVFCGGRSVYRYNATKNKCLRIPDMNITRTNPGVAAIDGVLYAFGGHSEHTYEFYEPLKNEWIFCGGGSTSMSEETDVISTHAFVISKDVLKHVKIGNIFQYYLKKQYNEDHGGPFV